MPSPLPPASEILARVRQVYRECSSYEDAAESTARTRVAGQAKAHTTIVRSCTAFERPDRLRFESVQVGVGPEDEWRRAVAWARDGSARSWWLFKPDAFEHEGLFEAAKNATNASPAALRVLALLLPDAKPHDPIAEDGIVAGVEHLDGVPCFVLELENVRGRTLRVHVERGTSLVRRTEETLVVDAAAREEIHRRTRDNLDSGPVPEGARQALRDMLARGPAGMPDTETQRITVFRPTLDPHIEPERFSFVPPAPPEILTAADPIVVRSSVQAPEVLARARAVYRSCATYLDTGEVTTTHRSTGLVPKHSRVLRFSTAFARSGGFRFEYKEVEVGPEDEWPHHVLWDDGSGCRSWWTVQPAVASHADVHEAIAAATGVSATSSYRVPTLLVPGGKGRDPLPLDANLEGTDDVDGAECYLFSMPLRGDGTEILWIDRKTYLILRVEDRVVLGARSLADQERATRELLEQGKVPESMRAQLDRFLARNRVDLHDSHVTTVTTYRPTIDADVAPDRFEFTPPCVGPPERDQAGPS